METIQVEGGVPVLSWCKNLEAGALEQITNAAKLPFASKHVCIMPDGHQGYGAPIGGVLASEGVVVPNFVGVDIGCGMCAIKTDMATIDIEMLKKILGNIRAAVPVGFKHHSKPPPGMPSLSGNEVSAKTEFESASRQIGTLGGGNHFIEIQKTDTNIWVMLHSGSRNIGLKVAKHYNEMAKEKNKQWHCSVPLKYDLAFFPIDTPEGNLYISEMNYCLEFALANRKLMMSRIKDIFNEQTGCSFKEEINIHHNYARMENHFGLNVMVHRKGATSAKKGELGLIPGSQGTSSYVVSGLGNKASMESCSHGAGRRMGRKEAIRTLNLDAEKKMLDDQGILHAIRGKEDLEEAAGAYKDIDVVMAEQADLVDIVEKLSPIAVIKG